MKLLKNIAVTTLALVSLSVGAQYQQNQNPAQMGGNMMPQGTFGGNYQPTMQPGAYRAPAPQGPGELAAYQQGGTQNCETRGASTRIANGALIDSGNTVIHGN